MNRREFFAAEAFVLSGVGAGCLERPIGSEQDRPDPGDISIDGRLHNETDDPQTFDVTAKSELSERDSVPVLTVHTVSDAVVTPDVERFSDMDPWGVFLASERAAAEYFGDLDEADSDEVQAFIEETPFADGDRLVYVQAFGPERCYRLELTEAPFIAEMGFQLSKQMYPRPRPRMKSARRLRRPLNCSYGSRSMLTVRRLMS